MGQTDHPKMCMSTHKAMKYSAAAERTKKQGRARNFSDIKELVALVNGYKDKPMFYLFYLTEIMEILFDMTQ